MIADGYCHATGTVELPDLSFSLGMRRDDRLYYVFQLHTDAITCIRCAYGYSSKFLGGGAQTSWERSLTTQSNLRVGWDSKHYGQQVTVLLLRLFF